MALILDSATQNISTSIGDTGTYSWEDVVALNSTLLDKYGDSSKPLYRWRGIIEIKTATLNIQNINLELYGISTTNPGIIRATDNGIINFGSVSSGNYINGCSLTITRKFYDSSNDFTLYAAISYTARFRYDTSAKVNLYNTKLYFNDLALIPDYFGRVVVFLSNIYDSLINLEKTDTDSRLNIVYMQCIDAHVYNTIFVNSSLEIIYSTDISNIKIINSAFPIISYIGYSENGIANLFISNISTLNTANSYYRDQSTSMNFINCLEIDLSNAAIDATEPSYPKVEDKKIFTHNIKLIDNNGNVNNALVNYAGRSNISNISNINGILNTFNLIIQETNITSLSDPGNYNKYPKPIPTVSYGDYIRTIKSYLHLGVIETLTIDNSLGSTEFPYLYNLNIDAGITQSNTTIVGAYTGITHTATTITVTQARTLNEIYDSRKLYWRNNNNINSPYIQGTELNLNGANLIVDGINLIPSSKFKSIKTAGIITYLNNGNTSFQTIDSNGIRYRIYGLPTSDSSLPVLRVKRINNYTITNPTVTNGESYINIIAGEDYEIRADARGFIASNFITINSNTSSELNIKLIEILDSNNNAVYGNGVQSEKDLITLDAATFTIFITYSVNYPTISLFSAIDKLEEILASNLGLELTAHPLYKNNKLVFIRDIVNNNQNSIKIKPAVGNTGDPELVFEVEREGDTKPYNLFDFSNSNGRIIKYPTTTNIAQFNGSLTVDSQQIATTVWNNTTRTLTDSPLTTEQDTKLNNLDVAVSTRLPSTSYTQAPTTTEIKTVIESSTVLAKETTTASRASQASVNLIPTNTLLITDNRLDTLDIPISSRLATSDYIQAPTVSNIRTELSAELSKLDATVSSRATSTNVWTNSNRSLTEGVIVTTNNDKNDYELSTNTINAIWNTLISSLTTIGSIGKRIVDYLDTSISSRLSNSNYINAPTTTDIRNELATELNRIDATISSRSSQTSLDDKPNLTAIESSTILAKQFTVLNIPTNPLLTNDIRLNTLDANISTRLPIVSYLAPLTSTETNTVITNALNNKDVVTNTNLTTTKTEILNAVNISGLTEEQADKLNEINNNILKIKKLRGLVNGINVLAKAPTNTTVGYLKTSDNEINLTITKNGDEEILSG